MRERRRNINASTVRIYERSYTNDAKYNRCPVDPKLAFESRHEIETMIRIKKCGLSIEKKLSDINGI